MQITIFTPTYNRAYILPRLFQSLKNQKATNFEWLIVDDGSSDDTESVVNEFIKDADFNIRYYKQNNQGKHIALNFAALNAEGEWIITIDSDDFIADNCLQVCQNLIGEIEAKKDFAGFTFLWAPENLNIDYKNYGSKKWINDEKYDWKFPGEMNFVIRTQILQKHPFPVIKSEKFCQESVQINAILRNYKMLYTDHILAFGEYLEDGLSQNLYHRLLKNPQYAMLAFKTKLSVAKTDDEKKMLAKNYWDIALKTDQPLIKTFFNFPMFLNLSYIKYRIQKKIKP